METGVWIYLWDLMDEGIDETLDRLLGFGFTFLNVAVSYHAGRMLLPHNPKRKVYILEGGTVYFTPRGTYGRLKPAPHSTVAAGDALEKVVSKAKQRGLKVKAWTVLAHNSRLGAANPDCATVNAFGDINTSILCPANQHVQEYSVNLCKELATHYDFNTIQIETLDFWGFEHGFHHEKIGVKLSDVARWLLTFCFCPACLIWGRREGIDADALRENIAKALSNYFENGEDSEFDHIPAGDLERFQQVRVAVVENAIGKVRDSVSEMGGGLLEYIIGPEQSWQRGAAVDPAQIAKNVDRIAVMAYYPTAEDIANALRGLPKELSRNSVCVGLQACHPFLKSPEQMRRVLRSCHGLGFNTYSFYNYGLVPFRVWGWIRDAVLDLSPRPPTFDLGLRAATPDAEEHDIPK